MKALIILAHGSRRLESNQEIYSLTEEVRKKARDYFKIIKYAFLELTEPQLLTVIDEIMDKDVEEITVLPYFLNSGNHVKQDVPEIIDAAIEKYPKCRFTITSCIGMNEGMAGLILSHVLNTDSLPPLE